MIREVFGRILKEFDLQSNAKCRVECRVKVDENFCEVFK